MIFSNEQLETLSQYEQTFNAVLDYRVCRNIGDRATAEIAQIWHSVKGTPLRRYTCSQCRYNLIKQVATAYRQDRAEQKAVETQKTEQKGNKTNEATKTTKRKRKAK